jgi:phosphoglycerate dehydrogenase-like enzyme
MWCGVPAGELWALDNVLISPHATDMTDAYPMKSARMLSENFRRFRQQEEQPLQNVVDTARGY